MNTTVLSIGYDDECLKSEAEELAHRLHLPIDNQCLPRLSVTTDKLVLLVQGYAPLYADFHSKNIVRRREAGKDQGIIRACRPQAGLRIVDATAGWGRDAALLASFGAAVLMIERQPVVAALLADALSRMRESNLKLSLICADAGSYLQSLSVDDRPDVIYIDPMHPVRQKSALVKKDMQVLQQLIGADDDAAILLQQALRTARQRVVIKWPQRLPPLLSPNHSIQGKTVRFDVYCCSDNVQKIPLSSVN